MKILIWSCLEDWWEANKVVSDMQGASENGRSCIHFAFLSQESILASLEVGIKCFEAYVDVFKAFDLVWTFVRPIL